MLRRAFSLGTATCLAPFLLMTSYQPSGLRAPDPNMHDQNIASNPYLKPSRWLLALSTPLIAQSLRNLEQRRRTEPVTKERSHVRVNQATELKGISAAATGQENARRLSPLDFVDPVNNGGNKTASPGPPRGATSIYKRPVTDLPALPAQGQRPRLPFVFTIRILSQQTIAAVVQALRKLTTNKDDRALRLRRTIPF